MLYIYLAIVIIPLVWYIFKKKKDYDNGQKEDDILMWERIFIIIWCIINPILFGAILYYALKSRYPKLAKFANYTSLIVFLIPILLVVLYTVLK